MKTTTDFRVWRSEYSLQLHGQHGHHFIPARFLRLSSTVNSQGPYLQREIARKSSAKTATLMRMSGKHAIEGDAISKVFVEGKSIR